MKIQLRFLQAALAITAFVQTVTGQGTAFTYQGRLADGTNAANGIYDLRFTVHDALSGGAPQGSPLTNSATGVSNGLFTVTLNFGAGVFNGANRFLEIGVRTNGGGAFTTLTPRQALTPTPYAVFAGGASASGLSGTIGGGQIAAGAIGTVHLSNSVSLWDRSGNNISYTNGNVGVGTATPQALLHVGGAMKLDGTNTFEFGAGVAGKEVNAGKIGYQTFTADALDIVGAGADGSSRRVNVWDLLHIGNDSADAGPRLITFGDADLVSIGENGEDDRMELTAAHFVFNNGSVGIGTGINAPVFPLSFADSLGDKISLFGQSGNSFGFGIQSSLLQIHTADAGSDVAFGFGSSAAMTETMRIKGNGNVGIGTSNPMTSIGYPGSGWDGLHTRGPNDNGLQIIQGVNSARLHLRADNNITNVAQDFVMANGANKIDFMWLAGGLANRLLAMTISTNGNVGIAGEVTTTAVNITSDRNAKEQFKPVNARDVLAKVVDLPISEWQYKTQADARHIGPMAQDFHAAFAVGRDDKHITSVDADGVALAAIQGLNEKFEEQTRLKDARIQQLEATVEELKALVGKLAAQHNGGAR